MTNFNEWEYLITRTNSIVDVEFYYMLEKQHSNIKVRIREEVNGWEETLGSFPNLEESMKAIEEYKEKVEKLAKYEEELF